MPSDSPLDNLARIGQLKREPPDHEEFSGLIRSGRLRLEDAANETLSIESRFDLVYDAGGQARRYVQRAASRTANSVEMLSSVFWGISEPIGTICGEP
jgi:hypothetical protein